MKNLAMVLRDESGATIIEYGLLAALISAAAVIALNAIGNEIVTTFNIVANQLQNVNATASTGAPAP